MSNRPNYVHPRVEALEKAVIAIANAMLETHKAIATIAAASTDSQVSSELTESANKIVVKLNEAVAQIVGRAP